MGKNVRKSHRRMKKTIRNTLGTLFLISAIVVAAIPTENLQAAVTPGLKVSVDIDNCSIPRVDKSETIYTTGDGQYQFAYVSPNNASSNNKVAVILGYNGGQLPNGVLTIPDTLDAYLKYSDNLGTTSGYVAVGKKGNFLFYSVEEQATDSQGNLLYDRKQQIGEDGEPVVDAEGNPVYEETPIMKTVYYPCYYEDRAKWQDLAVDEFYYENGSVSGGNAVYTNTTSSDVQRIQDAEVWYIGNQYLKAGTGDAAGTWTVEGDITQSSQGIFAGQGNIRTLQVGEKLSGIGNYAFYGCSGLSSITLGNGLDTIGNYAFANCINMNTVNLDLYSRVDIIGDHAFYNCQALQSFTMPISVTSVGDSAFEECYALTDMDLCGGPQGANVSLSRLGNNVFRNCANLSSLTFPRTFTNVNDQGDAEPLDVSMFKGCTSLAYISTSNNIIDFTEGDDPDYGFEEFKKTVPEEFYLEGLTDSPVHMTATEHNMAFSHLGKDQYEITLEDEQGRKAVYRVNSSDQLIYTNIDSNMSEVELPTTIGPYKIREIDSNTFRDNYNLELIRIPSSITAIQDNAFKGCYKLKNVIFASPNNLTYIGTDAFKTQDVSTRVNGSLPTLDENPTLNFTGDISYQSVPFQYAMNPESYINVGSQTRTYITYYSGWPTNLAVQYNPDTDKNELIDYPTFQDISDGTKYVTSQYAYMTDEYQKAAKDAVDHYRNDRNLMTDYEWEIINSALQIVLPEGIESIKDGLFVDREATENVEKTITAYSLNEIRGAVTDEDGNETTHGAFYGCKNLTGIYLMGGTTDIGDYAFEGCSKLTDVYLPTTVTTLGRRPFRGCSDLSYVNFQGSPYFTCDNSIIYQLDSNGNKQKIVEFLEGRDTGVVDASELVGVTEIAEDAFRGTKASSVDLRDAAITEVPEYAFADTSNLFAVYLPGTTRSINAHAFDNSAIQYMEVPGSVSYIDNDTFSGTTNKSGLTFYCEDDSNAYLYAIKNGIKTTSKPIEVYYTVTFWDYDATLLDTQTVAAGQDAVPPTVPGREGYIHTGWVPDYHGVSSDLQITAQYEAEDPDAKKYTVTFLDWDDAVLKTTLVLPGGDAEAPVDPSREGYTFIGWRPAVTDIQADTTIYAQYEKNDSTTTQYTVRFIDYDDTVLYTQRVNPGESAILPQSPTREGYTFTGWRPAVDNIQKDTDTYAQYEKTGSDNNSGSNNNGNNGSTNNGGTNNGSNNGSSSGNNNGSTATSKLYTLTVRNGSGSGSYAAGTQPIIIANDPAANQEFSGWTVDPSDVKLASTAVTATVLTMPEKNVTVTANYKAKSSSGSTTSRVTGSGNSAGSNSSSRPNNTSGTVKNGGTTVVIDKNGLSNTGVVSATVNGSSDNFTIKITESDAASEAVARALMAEYGDDLSSIKYFPMDISLYDSTGQNKITDTTGLSVSITLPLPDSLITYAGNNKVAGVVNDRLDKLTPKFTTISGVSCVTFTAEHFSPYVIYTDTNNLSAGVVSDNTPRTGDGIHPKWFLSIGLACVAMVLFMKKDKRSLKKVNVRA